MQARLKGKVAVVTGGVSGMGLGIVEMYVREGAKVVVADIQESKGAALEARFRGDVKFCRCDIRSEDDIARSISMAEEEFGGLDIMCHVAASPAARKGLADVTIEDWDDAQAVLLRSHVFLIKHSIPAMKRRGNGSIILFSSASCKTFKAQTPVAYVVAKGAVLHLGRWAAFDLAKDNIRVNVIVPGMYLTSIWGATVGASPAVADLMPQHLHEMASNWQPFPRYGRPSDIAYAATYLGSDESAFVTGTELAVDGGLSVHRPPLDPEYITEHLQNAKKMAEDELAAEE
ncbi:SDR family oxidoreductase [Sphingobium sp. JS3065]|uniref:SDR family NAD(P)-dependent oxidoreductase n=1 Tax=Sphingobium sp. JS3065 TaxID=2970925 RepID=UPI002263B6F0|nr:SDR family oxidoreductase [Sphingobium sp. JS3065]UZW56813.1 SDR family oxidoreductase [Sphingobium sp. JS3065]